MHHLLRRDAIDAALLSKILQLQECDPLGRDMCKIAGDDGRLPLHCCARNGTIVEVAKMLIEQYPAALLWKDRYGETPFANAKLYNTERENHEAMIKILEENTVGPIHDAAAALSS